MARPKSKRGDVSSFARYRPGFEAAIYILALLGILVVVHLWIQQGRGFDRGCLGFTTSAAVEASFDCEAVVQSSAGSLFGISNAVLGLLFYIGVAALTLIAGLRGTMDVRALKKLRFALVAIGLAYSLYLVYYQAAGVGGYCALCLISAGVVGLLFIVHLLDHFTGSDRRHSEVQASMKRPISFYAGLAALVVVLAAADVLYFNSLPDTPRQVASGSDAVAASANDPQSQCSFNQEIPAIANFDEFVRFSDPMKGNPQAQVTVLTYFDPNCPHCRTLDPIVEQVIEDHGEDARFVFKPFPLWQYSLIQVQALYAALQEGKFFEMMDRQFELQRQGGLDLATLRRIASEIGMDPDEMERRIQAGLYDEMIMSDRERGLAAGIRGMPTVVIDGHFVAGTSRSRQCLGELIERRIAAG